MKEFGWVNSLLSRFRERRLLVDYLQKLLCLFNKREKIQFGSILIIIFIGALLEMIGVGLVIPFIGLISSPDSIALMNIVARLPAKIREMSTNQLFSLSCIFLILFFFIKNAYLTVMMDFQYKFIYSKQADFSRRLFEKYLEKPYLYFLQKNTAELQRNINSEVTNFFSFAILPMFTVISECIVVLLIGILLLIINPSIVLIAIVLLASCGYIFSKLFNSKLQRYGLQQQYSSARKIQWVDQGFGGIKELKVTRTEKFFIEQYSKYNADYNQAMRIIGVVNQLPRLFIETVVIATLMVALLIIFNNGYTMSELIPILALFAVAAFRLMPSVNRIISGLSLIRTYMGAIDAIYVDLLPISEATQKYLGNVAEDNKTTTKTGIALHKVCFKYPEACEDVISNISLFIPHGSSVAFVGTSGAGKTTLIDIILGILPPSSGEVLVDDSNIMLNVAKWQRRLGYIPQSIYLYDDTIRSNIAFGCDNSKIDDEKIWDALRAAHLDTFVGALADGLETFVGERGVRLSGGQRQRIGIARAIYRDPEVLILDEATSSLDVVTENEIMGTVEKIREERTVIIIAHRLSTIESCDIIFEIKDGKLISTKTVASR